MQTQKRKKIKKRIKAKVYGTGKTPRLFVFKSNKHIYAGLADDTAGKTLLAVSDKDGKTKSKNTVDTAGKVGEELAKQAQKGGYKKVVFDRGGYRYHGKIKALAEGARKGGLKF